MYVYVVCFPAYLRTPTTRYFEEDKQEHIKASHLLGKYMRAMFSLQSNGPAVLTTSEMCFAQRVFDWYVIYTHPCAYINTLCKQCYGG